MIGESPHVVHPTYVVVVLVRDKDCVQVIKILSQPLLAEVRSHIDHDQSPYRSEECGGAQTLVARIGRSADRTVAPKLWYPARGTGAEEGECTLLHISLLLHHLVD